MTERVYLHVGEPKCGTTFVQQVLWAGRADLARQGVHLPGLSVEDQFRATQDLRETAQPPDDPSGSWAGEWDTLARQARSVDGVAVISHELLASVTAEQADRAVRSLQPAQVHVVVTVRDIASLLPAEWQETVKHQNRQAWERWVAAVIERPVRNGGVAWFWTVHDTIDVLRRWTGLVPPEHVHVITMPRRDAPRDLLWERFASVIGVAPGSLDTSVARPNASLGLAEVEMLRHLNRRFKNDRLLPEWFYSGHVKETLAHRILGARPAGPQLLLPQERDEWAREVADKVIADLDGAGYRVVGDLDELRPTLPDQPRASPSQVTRTQLLDAALDSLAGLLYERYETVTSRPTLRSTPNGAISGKAKLPGWYRIQRITHNATARHRGLARLRVFVWRARERARVWRSRG